MKSFVDKLGRQWRVDLNFALWQRIKAETGCDLLDIAMPDGQSLRQLTQMETLGVVLWLYVADQAAAAGIDRDDFWRALDGQAIHTAAKAIVDDLEDFSRSPQFSALRVAMEEAEQRVAAVSAAILDPEGEVRKLFRSGFSTPGNTPASLPESSNATPAPGACGISNGPPTDPDVTPGTVQV